MKKPPKEKIASKAAKLLKAIQDVADTLPEPRKSELIQLAISAGSKVKKAITLI